MRTCSLCRRRCSTSSAWWASRTVRCWSTSAPEAIEGHERPLDARCAAAPPAAGPRRRRPTGARRHGGGPAGTAPVRPARRHAHRGRGAVRRGRRHGRRARRGPPGGPGRRRPRRPPPPPAPARSNSSSAIRRASACHVGGELVDAPAQRLQLRLGLAAVRARRGQRLGGRRQPGVVGRQPGLQLVDVAPGVRQRGGRRAPPRGRTARRVRATPSARASASSSAAAVTPPAAAPTRQPALPKRSPSSVTTMASGSVGGQRRRALEVVDPRRAGQQAIEQGTARRPGPPRRGGAPARRRPGRRAIDGGQTEGEDRTGRVRAVQGAQRPRRPPRGR